MCVAKIWGWAPGVPGQPEVGWKWVDGLCGQPRDKILKIQLFLFSLACEMNLSEPQLHCL